MCIFSASHLVRDHVVRASIERSVNTSLSESANILSYNIIFIRLYIFYWLVSFFVPLERTDTYYATSIVQYE